MHMNVKMWNGGRKIGKENGIRCNGWEYREERPRREWLNDVVEWGNGNLVCTERRALKLRELETASAKGGRHQSYTAVCPWSLRRIEDLLYARSAVELIR